MRGHLGTIWLAALIVTCSLMCVPLMARATDIWDRGNVPFTLVGAQTPMEAQMLGEKPFQVQPTPLNARANLLSKFNSSLLPRNLEMHISVLYNRESAPIEPLKRGEASMLWGYSLDYRLLPNLKVGLNAYLYRPDSSDSLSMVRPFGDQIMGLGPGIKYDLGRWSFLVKSQMETGNRDQRADGVQNWFRVWYAF
jgi:hypothetical protein